MEETLRSLYANYKTGDSKEKPDWFFNIEDKEFVC